MLKSYTFGCGQGATKAMICCIENGTLNSKNCCVVNSTIKDIPVQYQDKAIIISDDPNAGCGKVRGAAKSLMARYLKNNPNTIDALITNDIDYINIIATTEGASGSGASVVLAQYIKQELDIPVIITLISGFESDIRGLQNTIDYFRDLNGGNFVIKTISNKKFLDKTNNTFMAEKMANEDISTSFKIVNADNIIDSDQNIDDTDHYKLITNPGMMFTTEVIIDKRLKNNSQLEELISNAIDYNSSLDFIPSATKIGIFMNISDENLEIIDTSFNSIKKKLCGGNRIPEFFTHRQYDSNQQEYIRVIASGMNLPKEELQEMYNKYQQDLSVSTNKEDDFFDSISTMDTSSSLDKTVHKKNNNFFDQFNDDGDNDEEKAVLGRNRRTRHKFSSSNTSTTTTESSSTNDINTKITTQNSNRSKFSQQKKDTPYSEDLIDGNY